MASLQYTFESVLLELQDWCDKIRQIEKGLPTGVPRNQRTGKQKKKMKLGLDKIRNHMPEFNKICLKIETLARNGENPCRMASALVEFREKQRVLAMNGGDSNPLTRFINRHYFSRETVAV